MTKLSNQEFFEQAASLALNNFKDPLYDGVTMIHCDCVDPDNNAMWGLRYSNDGEKFALFNYVSAAMAHRKATRYVTSTLAWLRMQTQEEEYIQPSKDPNRVEVLAVLLHSEDGQVYSRFFRTLRSSGKNQAISFEHMQDLDEMAESMGGNISDVLKKKKLLECAPVEVLKYADEFLSQFRFMGSPVGQDTPPTRKPS